LIDIFRRFHASLYTLPASPTESHSTVSGAMSANVNGKDGAKQGSFYNNVLSFSLMTASGEVFEVARDHELFNGVISGVGMLGVVLEATLQLKAIPSPYLAVRRRPAANVDALLAILAEEEKTSDLLVAWVDAYAGGRRTGRAVIHAANWVEDEASQAQREERLDEGYRWLESHRRLGLAAHELVGPLLSLLLYAQRILLSLFNRFYYRLSTLLARWRDAPTRELFIAYSFAASFTVPPAHLVCGPRGYTVQLSFPRERAREALVELLGICRASPCPPVTTVLRAHQRDAGLLSFSEDGYSLNFEFHPKKHSVDASRQAVDRLMDATARYGGRIHLTKDQVLTPAQFRAIFPEQKTLKVLKRRYDPEGLFTSDLAIRVGLLP
jgi:FAD/FMN-containing dehydrogenase